MTVRKKIFIIISAILIIIIGAFVIFHQVSKPTPDGERINTSTDVKMLVDLPRETPSRAITFTTDKSPNEKDYNSLIKKYKKDVLGGVEGDIPMVTLGKCQKITLRFQDNNSNNLPVESIINITADLTNKLANEENNIKAEVDYSLNDGAIIIDSGQFDFDKDQHTGEIQYTLIITAKYQLSGKAYTSITAVNVMNR